jgi:hypothetical protein
MATCPAPQDLLDETLFALSEGRLRLPSKPKYKTLWNWANYGTRSRRTQKLVFLEAVQIGGTWYTSIEAHRRFVKNLNAAGDA